MTIVDNTIQLNLDLEVTTGPFFQTLPLELQNIESFIWIDTIELIRLISPESKCIGTKTKFSKEKGCYTSIEEFNVPVNGRSYKCDVTISLRV